MYASLRVIHLFAICNFLPHRCLWRTQLISPPFKDFKTPTVNCTSFTLWKLKLSISLWLIKVLLGIYNTHIGTTVSRTYVAGVLEFRDISFLYVQRQWFDFTFHSSHMICDSISSSSLCSIAFSCIWLFMVSWLSNRWMVQSSSCGCCLSC